MKCLGIVLSLLLCAPVFAAPEKTQGASAQASENRKTEAKAGAAAAKEEAKGDSADGQEKTVSYRTPFGTVTRKASEEQTEPAKAELPVGLFEIEVKGSTVTIKKKTPFGVTSYSKPKNELTEEERDLVQRYQAAKADGSSAESAKKAAPTMPIPKKQDR